MKKKTVRILRVPGSIHSKRTRATFHLTVEVIDRLRNAAFALSGPPVRLTMAALAQTAFERELLRLQKEHNKGEPFPPRTGELQPGRPLKAPTPERVKHPPSVLLAKEAAESLNIATWTLYALVRSGELPHTRIGQALRFRPADLDAFLAKRTGRKWKRGSKGRPRKRPKA